MTTHYCPYAAGHGAELRGFGDQHEVELLVSDDRFSPLEAIKIATLNGATYLGRQARIGSVEAGKDADLMIVKGDLRQTSATSRALRSPSKTALPTTQISCWIVRSRYGEY